MTVLRELHADVIALQEADRRIGAREMVLPRALLDDSPWRVANVAKRPQSMGWHGNAILVRRDLAIDECHALDLPTLEPRGAACAVLLHGGQRFRVIGTHLDLSGLVSNADLGRIENQIRAGRLGDIEEKPATLLAQAMKSGHTRFPLYRETTENIVGVLHVKDFLRAIWELDGDASKVVIADIARKPYFAPETTTLQEQLDNFRKGQEQFALIVDEYGSIRGLVTMEDIIEEIVGEIEDEHDSPVQGVRPQSDGSTNVDGGVTIRDLNRVMDWTLPDAEAVTIAGLVIHESQSIPEVGQTFSFHGFRFRILRRRRNQITAIKVTPIDGGPAAPD